MIAHAHVRQKPRLRLAGRDHLGRPVWHALRGASVATGPDPRRALENLILVLPTRRKAR